MKGMRFEGLYDKTLIEKLTQNKIFDINFDLRPKSFNFIQEYKLLEMLDGIYSRHKIYLHFSNEQEYIIQHISKNVLEVLSKRAFFHDNLYLEFSDQQKISYYQQFDLPYAWHFTTFLDLREHIESHLFSVLVFNFNRLNEMHNQGEFQNFLRDFSSFVPLLKQKNIRLILSTDWGDNIFHTLFEYIEFDQLSLPINNKIESSYRNVHWPLLEQGIQSIKQVFSNEGILAPQTNIFRS